MNGTSGRQSTIVGWGGTEDLNEFGEENFSEDLKIRSHHLP